MARIKHGGTVSLDELAMIWDVSRKWESGKKNTDNFIFNMDYEVRKRTVIWLGDGEIWSSKNVSSKGQIQSS